MSDQSDQDRHEGLIEAAFRLTQERLGPVSALGILDEEAITAFLLGGVAVSATLLQETHGEQSASRSAAWGSYTKSGGARDPRSETATGGDFALVIWVSKKEARLAIFQAKKGVVSKDDGAWKMDIRRGPSETSFPNTQFVMLFANAILCSQFRGDETSMVVAKTLRRYTNELRLEVLSSIGWVHYLAYVDDAFKCVPLSACGDAVAEEFSRKTTVNKIAIESSSPTLQDVVSAGFGEACGQWLTISSDLLKKNLPALLYLMPVHTVDEKGVAELVLGEYGVKMLSGSPIPKSSLRLQKN